MYNGELRLDSLAVTEIKLRVTLEGVVIEASGVCKLGNGIGPQTRLGFSRTTTWNDEVLKTATDLVQKVEEQIGSGLGPGHVENSFPVAAPSVTEPDGDLAGGLTVPDQL